MVFPGSMIVCSGTRAGFTSSAPAPTRHFFAGRASSSRTAPPSSLGSFGDAPALAEPVRPKPLRDRFVIRRDISATLRSASCTPSCFSGEEGATRRAWGFDIERCRRLAEYIARGRREAIVEVSGEDRGTVENALLYRVRSSFLTPGLLGSRCCMNEKSMRVIKYITRAMFEVHNQNERARKRKGDGASSLTIKIICYINKRWQWRYTCKGSSMGG